MDTYPHNTHEVDRTLRSSFKYELEIAQRVDRNAQEVLGERLVIAAQLDEGSLEDPGNVC
jgi:hypothetical protein